MSRSGCLVLWVGIFLTALSDAITQAQTPAAAQRAAISAASELFELFGMDEAFFGKFRDGQPWNEAEDEPLVRVLLRLSQIKPMDLERWTQRNIDASDIASHPEKYRRQFVRLLGQVRRVTRVTPSSEQQERYDMAHYYRCEMALGDGQRPAVVFARNVPKKWELDAQIDEPASANVLFLKSGSAHELRERTLYFAADRVAWHPDTVLGGLGMDYGLFDDVQHDRQITNSDRECFFRLLDAAKRAPADAKAAEEADATLRLVGLMDKPQSRVGELHSFRGVARRVVKIHVSDPDTVARFGFDHYFELVVFVELDGFTTIAGKKVRNHPVVFCVRELPADMPTGDNIAEMVRASGFMFKKWRYTTQIVGKEGLGLLVTSPLLIGKTAEWERREEVQNFIGPIVGGVLIALLTCIVLFAWWFNRRERRIHDALLARSRKNTNSASLNSLELDASDEVADMNRD